MIIDRVAAAPGSFATSGYSVGESLSEALAYPNYKRLDHGASDFDHRNVLSITYVWLLPKTREGSAAFRQIVNTLR